MDCVDDGEHLRLQMEAEQDGPRGALAEGILRFFPTRTCPPASALSIMLFFLSQHSKNFVPEEDNSNQRSPATLFLRCGCSELSDGVYRSHGAVAALRRNILNFRRTKQGWAGMWSAPRTCWSAGQLSVRYVEHVKASSYQTVPLPSLRVAY